MEGYQEPNLYEPTFGLPIVRRRISYAELLKDIRLQKVQEISYFDSNQAPDESDKYRMRNLTLEGYCLVIYNDTSVAQVHSWQTLFYVSWPQKPCNVLDCRFCSPA